MNNETEVIHTKAEEAIHRIAGHKFIHKMNEPRAVKISEALDMAMSALRKEIPHLVTVADFNDKSRVDDFGYLAAWCEEKDGDLYVECITETAVLEPNENYRHWSSKPTPEDMEAEPW